MTQVVNYAADELPYAEPCFECGGKSVAFTSDGQDLCQTHASVRRAAIETARGKAVAHARKSGERALSAIRGHVYLNAKN
jgi:hypothetical protein